RTPRGIAEIRRIEIQGFGAASTRFLGFAIERVTEICEDNFGEVRIKLSQLVELTNKTTGWDITVLECRRSSCRSRKNSGLNSLTTPKEEVENAGNHDDVERNTDQRILDREVQQNSEQLKYQPEDRSGSTAAT